jgi:hypothetical protein
MTIILSSLQRILAKGYNDSVWFVSGYICSDYLVRTVVEFPRSCLIIFAPKRAPSQSAWCQHLLPTSSMPIPKETTTLREETLRSQRQSMMMRDLYLSTVARGNVVDLATLPYSSPSSSEVSRDDLLTTLQTAMRILHEDDDDDDFKATRPSSHLQHLRQLPRETDDSQWYG